jgi:hypothetical protein
LIVTTTSTWIRAAADEKRGEEKSTAAVTHALLLQHRSQRANVFLVEESNNFSTMNALRAALHRLLLHAIRVCSRCEQHYIRCSAQIAHLLKNLQPQAF